MIDKTVSERDQLSAQARQRVEQHYSIETASSHFSSLYEKLVKNMPAQTQIT
jgi:hypothetical protein